MNILGFDPSLTSSGYAYRNTDGHIVTGRVRPKKLKGVQRLDFIGKEFYKLLQMADADVVVYEGYAMGYGGKNPGRVFDIGELGGVLRLIAYRSNTQMLLVAPTSLKMFATLDGSADKDTVIQSIRERWGAADLQNDEADAYALYKLGEAYFHIRKRRGCHPKQQEALQKPELILGDTGL